MGDVEATWEVGTTLDLQAQPFQAACKGTGASVASPAPHTLVPLASSLLPRLSTGQTAFPDDFYSSCS